MLSVNNNNIVNNSSNVIWKDVVGFENYYEVSNDGRVRNKSNQRELKLHEKETGYYYVALSVNKKRKNCTIHRLIANAFISNPSNLPYIDHINRDRKDNRIENLRWCTQEENANNKSPRKSLSKRGLIYAKDKEGNVVFTYKKLKDVEKDGFCLNSVRAATNSQYWNSNFYKGYWWSRDTGSRKTKKQSTQRNFSNKHKEGIGTGIIMTNLSDKVLDKWDNIQEAIDDSGFSYFTIRNNIIERNKIVWNVNGEGRYFYFKSEYEGGYRKNYSSSSSKRPERKVGKYDKETGELIEVYKSIKEAKKENNIKGNNISECALYHFTNGKEGRYKSVSGYIWRWLD